MIISSMKNILWPTNHVLTILDFIDEYSSLLDEDDLWSLTSTQRVNFLRALRGKLMAEFWKALESFEKVKYSLPGA